jgi:hypothetical protein
VPSLEDIRCALLCVPFMKPAGASPDTRHSGHSPAVGLVHAMILRNLTIVRMRH